MKTIKKIWKTGTSQVITIEKEECVKMNLKVGDFVRVEIIRLK